MPTGRQQHDQEEGVSLWAQWREMSHILAPIVLVTIAAVWLASRFIEPAPPRTLVMTSGGPTGAYFGFAKRYAEVLAKSGIRLDVQPSAGSVENARRLTDPRSGYTVGLLQGGIVDGAAAPDLVSLGRVFLEPIWIFHRSPTPLDNLAGMKGQRIAIGPDGSGTRALAEAILKPNGITSSTATLSPLTGTAAVEAMAAGQLDAVMLVQAAESKIIQDLLRDTRFKLLSFAQADAHVRLFPFLEKIILPRGVVDLVGNVPAEDVTMLAASAALVARKELHPALSGLLVKAVQEVHGGGGLFHRAGEFPKQVDPEFPVSDDALLVYRSGQSWLKRHLPFWMATFIERIILMIVPLAGILLPLFKVVPVLYRWRIKRRILYWYEQLKRLERRMIAERTRGTLARFREDIDRIEDSISVIPVPLSFSEQLYNLRSAVQLVRQKIDAGS